MMGTNYGGGGQPLLTDDDIPRVRQALTDARGIRALAAVKLRISRVTLWRFMRERPELQELASEITEELKDFAEGKMLEQITSGDGQMIRFYLGTQAGDRGYSLKTQVSGPGGGPIPVATIDLSRLSFHEQRQMLELYRKASSDGENDGG